MSMRVSEYIREHLYNSLTRKIPDLENLKKTEWSDEFERLMRNRLIMGRFRYGSIGLSNRPTKSIIEDIKRRADLYIEDPNIEYMVDIANLAMKIFVADPNPNKYFKSEDDKIHVE
uniref:Uncharacterized protein n=1 Tax=viral metagenome TaxID=1070528 RepID=A0A6M3IDD0_9ZZZZ